MMTQKVNDQVTALVSLIEVRDRSSMLRSELGKRHSELTLGERETESIDGISQWLAITCTLFYQDSPSETDLVKVMAMNDSLAIAILHVESLVDTWSRSSPSLGRHACLRSIIALLMRVEAKKEELQSTVKDEFIASYLLSCALWNEKAGRPLLGNIELPGMELFRTQLYEALVSKQTLIEVVNETQRWFPWCFPDRE